MQEAKALTGYRIQDLLPEHINGSEVFLNGEKLTFKTLLEQLPNLKIADQVRIGNFSYRTGHNGYLARYYAEPEEESLVEKIYLMSGFIARIVKHLEDGILINMTDEERNVLKQRISLNEAWLAKANKNTTADKREIFRIENITKIDKAFLYGSAIKRLEDLSKAAGLILAKIEKAKAEERTISWPQTTSSDDEIDQEMNKLLTSQTQSRFQAIADECNEQLSELHTKMGTALVDAMSYSDAVKLRDQGIDNFHGIISAADTRRFFSEAAGEIPKASMKQKAVAKFYQDKAIKALHGMHCIDNIADNIKAELDVAIRKAIMPEADQRNLITMLEGIRIAVKGRIGTRGSNTSDYYPLQRDFMLSRSLFLSSLDETKTDAGTKDYIKKLVSLIGFVSEYRMHLNDSLTELQTKRQKDKSTSPAFP